MADSEPVPASTIKPAPSKLSWQYFLRPIWIWTAVGPLLSVILFVLSSSVDVDYSEIHWSAQGLDGGYGGYSSTVLIIGLLPTFGFFGGLMVALWNKRKFI